MSSHCAEAWGILSVIRTIVNTAKFYNTNIPSCNIHCDNISVVKSFTGKQPLHGLCPDYDILNEIIVSIDNNNILSCLREKSQGMSITDPLGKVTLTQTAWEAETETTSVRYKPRPSCTTTKSNPTRESQGSRIPS